MADKVPRSTIAGVLSVYRSSAVQRRYGYSL